jgi:hypothetical protein
MALAVLYALVQKRHSLKPARLCEWPNYLCHVAAFDDAEVQNAQTARLNHLAKHIENTTIDIHGTRLGLLQVISALRALEVPVFPSAEP